MNGNFFENVKVVHAMPSGSIVLNDDMFNGSPVSDVISLANYRKCIFLITKNAGALGTAKITVESCDDTSATVTTAVGFNYWIGSAPDTWGDKLVATTAGVDTPVGADKIVAVEIESGGLSGTDKYVRLKLTEVVDDPVSGGVAVILANARYLPGETASA